MNEGGNSSATILSESKEEPLLSIVDASTCKEEVDTKLDLARQQLLALRRQQEELERQKNELEELRRKQEEFSRGRAEMIDNLQRGSEILERDQIQAQRLAEICDKTREAFADYLERIQAINDQEWTSANVRGELSKALAVIDGARLEYNRARTKLENLNPTTEGSGLAAAARKGSVDWDELQRYLWIGAAASAPLIVAGTLWLIALIVSHAAR